MQTFTLNAHEKMYKKMSLHCKNNLTLHADYLIVDIR